MESLIDLFKLLIGLFAVFALYVVYGISKLNYRINLIVKRLNADKEKIISNEEIEKELNDGDKGTGSSVR